MPLLEQCARLCGQVLGRPALEQCQLQGVSTHPRSQLRRVRRPGPA